MPFVDSRHLFSTFLLLTLDIFTLDSRLFYSRLFSLDSRLLLSTLDFYSRLSTITLDSRHLLSTLDPRLLDTLHKKYITLCSLVLLYFLTQYTGGELFSALRKVKKNRESYRQASSEKNILSLQ